MIGHIANAYIIVLHAKEIYLPVKNKVVIIG